MTNQTIAPELVQLDPKSLIIGANARVDVAIDPELVASIAERGVIQPIVAHRAEDGSVIVRMGQRRTLAAVEAGVATVPVILTAAPTDEADRIVEQVEENDRRAAMSETDRVAVASELALMGFTPAQIAKRTRRDRAEVEAALTVAHSTAAQEHMSEGMDLATAAALAEFEGDEDATARIEQAARFGNPVEHTVARIRQDRRAAELVAARAAELADAGVRVIERPERWYGYGPRPETMELAELVDKEGREWRDMTDAHRQVCTGHVVWLTSDGESVSETAGCEGWRKNGHKVPSSGSGSTQSAEDRRHVIESNKAWLAADEVRREFVKGIAKGAKAPKGAERFVTEAIAFGRIAGASAWYELRGVKAPELWHGHVDPQAAKRALSRLSGPKLAVANLTMALGYMEHQTSGKGSWRTTHPEVAAYLTTLQGWGYQLSEIEAEYLTRQAEAEARAAERDAEADRQCEAEDEAQDSDADE